MKSPTKILLITVILLAGAILFLVKNHKTLNAPAVNSMPSSPSAILSPANLADPISQAKQRITKKPFGIFVSPGHSPISPERFTGYHTGVDFETFSNEQNSDVPVYAFCQGNLLYKNWVSGYGGVAIQSCVINGQPVTVLYGHLQLTSIDFKIGDKLSSGQKIGVLGKGYSTETDGERKHLHLSIHRGNGIELLGYVQDENQLKNWIDPAALIN